MNTEKKLFSLGGGEREELTGYEASSRFMKKNFPDLRYNCIRYPQEKICFGLNPEVPMMAPDEWKDRAEQMKVENKNALNTHQTLYKGAECEFRVWKYLEQIPETTVHALFHGYTFHCSKNN